MKDVKVIGIARLEVKRRQSAKGASLLGAKSTETRSRKR